MSNMRAFMVATAVGTVFQVAMATAQSPTAQTAASPVKLASPQATTADFSWLSGAWESSLPNGVGVAHVVFGDASGGVLTGVMHLVSPQNKVLIVELIALVDTRRGVEMRFRHFSPELVAWETDFKQSMLLTSHTADRDVFVNQVPFASALMSTQPRTTTFIRQADGSYVGRTDVLDEKGGASVIEGVYHRVK